MTEVRLRRYTRLWFRRRVITRDVASVNFFSSPSPAFASPSPGTIFESESGKHVASPPSPSPSPKVRVN